MMRDIATSSAQGVATILGIGNVGPVTAQKLVELCPTLADVLSAAGEADRHPALNQKVRITEAAMAEAFEKAEKMLARTRAIGGEVLSIYDPAYPMRLFQIPDAPMLLHVMGDIGTADRSAGCVGTREITRYGRAVTTKVTGLLVENGFTIVSGLANGVDMASHETTLAEHGVTVACLGSGLDRHRNPQVRAMADRIVSAGGAVLSEAPCGTDTDANLLIRRNRIISGLSCGVFVMQADLGSGTMHTVRYALLQGRPLFVPVPPEAYAHEDANRGNIALASQTGRQLITTLEVKPAVKAILERDFADVPAVHAIRGRDDYPAMLATLAAASPAMAPAL